MRKAFSYSRFSKPEQAKGDSLRRQGAGPEAYCKQKGLQLDDGLCLLDPGVSAFRGKNAKDGALAVFLEAVRIGRVPPGSVLIIENLDRLSRREMLRAFDLFRGLLEAGISITTLMPFREYTPEDLNSLEGVIEPLLHMHRAHEESAVKSERCGAAWQSKRERLSEEPATSVCPAWLRLKDDGTGFEVIPDKAQAVLRVFELARDGFGLNQTCRKLREEGVPPIGGRANHWVHSYVSKLLRSRAVLGEFQPGVYKNGKRVLFGDPVPGYYPAIMTEADFLATRRTVEQRKRQRGPQGEGICNLFTEILFDARDGRSMHVLKKGLGESRAVLVSSGAAHGETDSQYISFPYKRLEDYFLHLLQKEVFTDAVRGRKNGAGAKIAALTSKLTDLDSRIQTAKKKYATAPDSEALLDLILQLEAEKKTTAEALHQLQQDNASSPVETLGEARGLFHLLAEAKGEELLDLRTRLKARIRLLCREIWVLTDGPRGDRVARVQVFFFNGRGVEFTARQKPRPAVMSKYAREVIGLKGEVYSYIGHGINQEKLPPEKDLRRWRELNPQPAPARRRKR